MHSETLKRLINEAVQRGAEEAKIILILERWYRQGPSYIDEQDFTVIYGSVEEVTLEEFDEGYPYRKGERVALIPKSVPAIVMVERHDNTQDREIHEKVVYVFTKEGWKKLQVQ